MKKVLAFCIVMALMLTGLTVYAKPRSNTPASSQTTATAVTAASAEVKKVDKAKAFAEGIKVLKPQFDTIRLNNEELNKLQEESKTELNRVQKILQAPVKKTKELTEEKILKIKAILSTINADQEQLNTTAGKIEEQNKILKSAKRNKDLETYKAAVAAIITIQNDRKAALTKIIIDMKAVTAI